MTDDAPIPTDDGPGLGLIDPQPTESESPKTPYRVLARKYRPQDFSQLIGQEALVRTLSNAIRTGRLAHAYMLTGVRGVGKTTTARIIAKALNYVGPDGQGGPSIGPFDDCPICRRISGEEGHIDIIEMDAASRTGVDDVREVIESARLRPMEARYKVFIIDEVHMLSKNAFNALLKTLEEPPEHVKFIFATTEIRKVPVTVLSRCQRFDLRRVDAETLFRHFTDIIAQEGAEAEAEAVKLIARAADGSVRDGLSILDQALALADGIVTESGVRDMLGLIDRENVIDLFEAVMSGDAAAALAMLDELHAAGADPAVTTEDLLDFTHFLTRAKAAPKTAEAEDVPEAERERGGRMAARLPMDVLARAWQMLLKGLGEVQIAPNPRAALEMLILRMIYAAGVEPPGRLIERYKQQQSAAARGAGSGMSGNGASGNGASASGTSGNGAASARAAPSPTASAAPAAPPSGSGGQVMALPQRQPPVQQDLPPSGAALPTDLHGIVALCRAQKKPLLASEVRVRLHLISLDGAKLELRWGEGAPRGLTGELKQTLEAATGCRWAVVVRGEGGAPTLTEQEAAHKSAAVRAAEAHPIVAEILREFPTAGVIDVRDLTAPDERDGIVGDPGGLSVPDDDGYVYDDGMDDEELDHLL